MYVHDRQIEIWNSNDCCLYIGRAHNTGRVNNEPHEEVSAIKPPRTQSYRQEAVRWHPHGAACGEQPARVTQWQPRLFDTNHARC